MATWFRTTVFTLLVAGLAACAPPAPSFSDNDANAIRESVRQYVATVLAGNWEAWSNLMTEDVVFLVPNAAAVEGRASVRAFGEAFPHITALTAEAVEVTGHGEVAFSRGTFAFTASPASGPQITDTGKFLATYRRQLDGSWGISRHVWNSDLPLPPSGARSSISARTSERGARDGWVRWERSARGNGHWYKAVLDTNRITWSQAAQAAKDNGGYLTTITSEAENGFVFNLVNSPAFFPANGAGPALGGFQPDGSREPDGGWRWVTGEPWGYANWDRGQPDNGFGSEEKLHFFSGSGGTPAATWNDIRTEDAALGGYVVERVTDPKRT